MAWIYWVSMHCAIHAWRGSTGCRCTAPSTRGVDLLGADALRHPRVAWIYWA